MITVLKPPKLRADVTIGIVAPCQPILPSFRPDYEKGKQKLEDMGFKLVEGKTIGLKHWYSAGTPEQQADDINSMFGNPNIKALISAAGGVSAIGVLDKLDYDLIRKNPKPFIGMSDMTHYHLALYAKTGLVGFHMDEVSWGIGWNWSRKKFSGADSVKHTSLQILTLDKPLGELPHITPWQSWRSGKAQGRLIGGNIGSMTYQMGTSYFPDPKEFDGAVLFWEAVGKPIQDIRKSLFQLKYYGVLERISGMLIGTITAVPPFKDESIIEPTVKDVVLEVTKQYDFPILAGMDFGHYTVNLPMPIGIKAELDTKKLSLKLLESAVI